MHSPEACLAVLADGDQLPLPDAGGANELARVLDDGAAGEVGAVARVYDDDLALFVQLDTVTIKLELARRRGPVGGLVPSEGSQ